MSVELINVNSTSISVAWREDSLLVAENWNLVLFAIGIEPLRILLIMLFTIKYQQFTFLIHFEDIFGRNGFALIARVKMKLVLTTDHEFSC